MTNPDLFGTDGIRAVANQPPLTPRTIVDIGGVLGWMMVEFPGAFSYPHGQNIPDPLDPDRIESTRPKAVIVRDPRRSGDMITSALIAGLTAAGADVVDGGILPTPASSTLTRHFGANLGISISASHNPPEYNGIKLFTPEGQKVSSHLEKKIEQLLDDEHEYPPVPVEGERIGTVDRRETRAARTYVDHLMNPVEEAAFEELHVVVDAGYGAACPILSRLFEALGVRTTFLAAEPDGDRINQNAGIDNLERLTETVTREEADLGIALDGDADRVLLVDETGTVRNGDDILAALATDLHARDALPGNRVVGTVMTNQGLAAYLDRQGMDLHRTAVGDRNIAHALFEEDGAIGGEQSGHIILYDRSPTGDALQTAIATMSLMDRKNQPASELLSLFDTFPQVLENVQVDEKPPLNELDPVNERIDHWEETLENQGRVLLRYSGTEPVCRVMVEGTDQELIREAADDLAGTVRESLPR